MIYVALCVHGPDTEIVGAFSERDFALAAARARCRDNFPGESEPMVIPFLLNHDSSPAPRRR